MTDMWKHGNSSICGSVPLLLAIQSSLHPGAKASLRAADLIKTPNIIKRSKDFFGLPDINMTLAQHETVIVTDALRKKLVRVPRLSINELTIHKTPDTASCVNQPYVKVQNASLLWVQSETVARSALNLELSFYPVESARTCFQGPGYELHTIQKYSAKVLSECPTQPLHSQLMRVGNEYTRYNLHGRVRPSLS